MTLKKKPRLSIAQIVNMSLGFLGIQFGFALQSGNASRILQTFGADVEHLSLFWLAAPLTGMIIQPIVGHYSDRTWTRLGRRRPYFLGGALLSAVALILMPNAAVLTMVMPAIWIGAGMLMIMDASFNVAMEPFRALVADKLPHEQRSTGFSVQSFLIGVGAVIGSWLPYIFAEYMGVAKTAAPGHVPDNVIYSFYAGAAVLVLAILWTVVTTREYTPAEVAGFDEDAAPPVDEIAATRKGIAVIFTDFARMPKAMKQLGVVQFFSWFALFSMWVFTTPAIAQHVYGVRPEDTASTQYADAANWVGFLFGIYNGVAALYALMLPFIAKRLGQRGSHAVSLAAGGISLVSMFFIGNPTYLVVPMVGIGIAWGSILAMPYAILSKSIPTYKMGVYMGIFNFFITFPQLVNGFFGGYIVKYAFGGHAIFSLVMAGVLMLAAAVCVLRVEED
ncbi:MFS transporter [Parapedobacter sp. 2B3]|uniref:MFS transporter n=1 Tax=Parapedobacter sp. 2B3 TaxID=3342381 RepID=UPI0035B64D7C